MPEATGSNAMGYAQMGIGIGMNAANIISQNANNRKQREFANDMYAKQRYDAISDWNRDNLYNSPAEQMKRLKAAGLNPNLVYGTGSATSAAPMPRASSPGNYNPHALDFSGISQTFNDFNDLRMKNSQIDLMQEQIKQNRLQQQLTGAQTLKTMADTDLKKVGLSQAQFDLMRSNSLMPFDLQAAALSNQQKQVNIDFTKHEDLRQEAKNAVDLGTGLQNIIESESRVKKNKQEIENMKQNLENAKTSGAILELDRLLKSKGLSWSDPWYARTAAAILNGVSLEDITKGLQDIQSRKDTLRGQARVLAGQIGTAPKF